MKIGSTSWKEIIRSGAGSLGIDVDARQIDQFARYADELIQWNRKINLTAITDAEALAVKHFLDSIAPGARISMGARLLDIGSGAGFPGIPLKIIRPDLRVTLIDSVRKKVNFQKHVIRTLGLENIGSHQVRAEQFSMQNAFDGVMTRALSSLSEFAALARPLLAKDGVMLAWKGRSAEVGAEVSTLLSGENGERLQVTLWPYRLPGIEAERTVVVVREMSAAKDAP